MSSSALSCALVIPCYNEATRLPGERFLAFARERESVQFIFVNDGSKDETSRVLRELAAQEPERMSVIDNAANQGKAAAVRQGVLHAIDQTSAEVVGFWDADLATPLESVLEMSEILQQRERVWMIFGARVQLLGRQIERKPQRHYLGRVFATVVSNLLRLAVYDTQCGAKLFRRNPYLRQLFEAEFVSRWIFDVEIIARFLALPLSVRPAAAQGIYEYPLPVWRDVDGSKVKPSDFLKAFKDLFQIKRRYSL